MSLHMFVVVIVVFFYQRFLGLSLIPNQCYLTRDQVCR